MTDHAYTSVPGLDVALDDSGVLRFRFDKPGKRNALDDDMVAALIAGGIYGIENELELEPIFEGNAYVSDAPRVPSSLREATALFAESAVARAAFGDDVVDHYLNNALIEQKAYDAAITDWERVRGFERF